MGVADNRPVPLTELTSCGGCAAKWGASLLGELVAAAKAGDGRGGGPDRLLVGLADADDAAVVELADGIALVSTIDFFPPLVDDPADYGAIAAANACSDIFAMGGDVVLALNVAAFPESLPTATIQAILRAAAEVVADAGGIVAGGHTIRSPEPIFGLAVQGIVVPGQQFTKSGARPGDVLVLSKPLGAGLALASGDADVVAAAVAAMRRLNREAAQLLRRHHSAVHAVTDVTGFGLLGHGWEMAERSGARLVFEAASLPLIEGVGPIAEAGVRTGGDRRNRDYLRGHAVLPETDDAIATIATAAAFDPQTSGGLLAAVAADVVDELAAGGFVPVGGVAAGVAGVILR